MKRKNIFEALYYGEIAPYEKCFNHSPEFVKCVATISDSEEKLCERLNEEERALLDRLTNAEGDLSELSILEYFAEGFRLGAAFMLETFMMPEKG